MVITFALVFLLILHLSTHDIVLSFYNITDLNFKTQMRSAVSVREGQGVVLLCGTPIYAGGEALKHYLTISSLIVCFINHLLIHILIHIYAAITF